MEALQQRTSGNADVHTHHGEHKPDPSLQLQSEEVMGSCMCNARGGKHFPASLGEVAQPSR